MLASLAPKRWLHHQTNFSLYFCFGGHITFGAQLARYSLNNHISDLPRETLEAAYKYGVSHFTTFVLLVLWLSRAAVASLAIVQFTWGGTTFWFH